MKKGEKLLYGRDKLDLKDKYNVSREKPMDSKHSSLENSHIRFSNLNINALYESMNSRVVNGNGRG